MGETRDPALGGWVVFEGDKTVATTGERWAEGINRPVVWPITLRYAHVRDGVIACVDVELSEDGTVAVLSSSMGRHDDDAVVLGATLAPADLKPVPK